MQKKYFIFEKRNFQKGSILLYSVMILTFVIVMGLVVAQIIYTELGLGVDFKNSQAAHYSTQAGTERSLISTQVDTSGHLNNNASYRNFLDFFLGGGLSFYSRGELDSVQRQGEMVFIKPIVSAGYFHSLVVRSDGHRFGWGDNLVRQLGDGTTIRKISPIQIDNSWLLVDGGRGHSLGINSERKLFAWGSGSRGQLGDGTNSAKSIPTQIGDDNWLAISAGDYHSLGINSEGRLFAWGSNDYGQLCVGDTEQRNSPTQIGNESWLTVAAGEWHTLAIRSDGKLFACGRNQDGELGDGTTDQKNSLIEIGNGYWSSIAAGNRHSLGINSNGNLFAWGNNGNGALGTGSGLPVRRLVPTQIGNEYWQKISAGFLFSLGIKSDNKLYAWGYNGNGRLGDGTDINRFSPVLIGSEYDNWQTISAGSNFSLGILFDGRVFAWGNNSIGQLGDGTNEQKILPTFIIKF